VRLELEELVDHIFVFDCVEDVGGERYDILEWLVEVVALQTELKLTDVFASNALIIEVKELRADSHRVDVVEADGEEHLAVAMQFL